MRLRSLSALILLPTLSVLVLVLVLVTASPTQAAGDYGASAPKPGVWKNSASRRPGIVTAPLVPTPAPSAAQVYQDRVLALTNDQRRDRGLAPLALSTCADRFADSWASSQAKRDTLGHQPLQPIATECAASMVGENVGYGNITPEQLVALWMGSPGHRQNILRPEYTHLGVGAATTGTGRWFGVQVFARL